MHLRHRGDISHIVMEGHSGGVHRRFRVGQDGQRIVRTVTVMVEQDYPCVNVFGEEMRPKIIPDELGLILRIPWHARSVAIV